MHGACEAAATGAMNIEERDPIPFLKGAAPDVGHGSTDALQGAGAHMARDDGIRHAGQAPLPERDVRAADLRQARA